MNGGDEFYVRFENNESDEVTYAEVTDNDDGSYAVKFNTMVTITSFDTYGIVSFILIFLCAPICQVAGTYTCSVMIGADEHVAD